MSAYNSETNKLVKLRKAYVVENGKLVKLKKAYTVEGGKLVKIWSGGEILYYGEITPMAYKRQHHSGLSFAERAFFFGGASNNCETYNSSLTLEEIPSSSISGFSGISGVVLGNHALVLSGQYGTGSSYYKQAYAFDESFTRSTMASATNEYAYRCAAAIGDYAIFSGGQKSGSYWSMSDVYDVSLTKNEIELHTVGPYGCATTLGDYAIFCNGYGGGNTLFVQVDSSLTRTLSTLDSSGPLWYSSMVTLGDYAIHAGGRGNNAYSGSQSNVYAIDKSMTITRISSLSAARDDMSSCVLGEYAIFAGGELYESGTTKDTNAKVVDLYDMSLTRTVGTSLTGVRTTGSAAAVVGEYAVISGGSMTASSNADKKLATAEAFYLS